MERDKNAIKEILKENGYPEEFVERTISKIENPTINRRPVVENPIATTSIPYISGFSDRLRRLGNKFNIRTVFNTTNTLRSILTKTKPINADQNSKNCVY